MNSFVSKYQSKIEQFLNARRCTSDKYTHVAMGENFYGKFLLNDQEIVEFNNLYAKAISKNCVFSIGEKVKEYGPIMIDIDLENNNNNERLYNNDMIIEIIDAYREVITQYFTYENYNLYASVFEKPEPTIKKDNIIKDGVHIIFHDLICHYKAKLLIREKVIKLLKKSETFDGYDLNKVIDKQVVHTNSWLLPGSKKKDGQLYTLTKIYNCDNKLISIDETINDKNKMMEMYSIQSETNSEEYSLEYNDGITLEIIEEKLLKIKNKDVKNNKIETTPINENNNNEKLNKIKIISEYLNTYDEYTSWTEVGMAMKNELKNNGLSIYLNWSSQSKKYNMDECIKHYNSFKNNGELKIASLIYMVKNTNPDKYDEMIARITKLKKSLNGDYELIKTEFEKTNFKLKNPISFINITDDTINGYIMRTRKDFKDVYENLRINTIKKDGEIKDESFIDKWLKDPNNRTYNKMDFLPMQNAPDNVYNIFRGYEAENKKLYDVKIEESLIYKHIGNLCNNNEKVIEYVIKTLAIKLQKPYQITNTAIIFKSVEGCGKDVFFNWFGNKILGSSYYYNTEKVDNLFGKFNCALENKILVIINETNGKETGTICDIIKGAITAETNKIEHKNFDSFANKNHIEYIFLTNNDNPVKILPGDRRFCGIECNNDIANNREYFDALIDEMNSGKYDKAFYDYLMSIDIERYDFTNNRPITDFYKNIRELNKPSLIVFIEDLIYKNTNKKVIEIPSNELFNLYSDFCIKSNFKNNITITKFIMDVKKIDGIDNKRTNKARYITFNVEEIKKYLHKKYNTDFNEGFIDEETDTDNEDEKTVLDN